MHSFLALGDSYTVGEGIDPLMAWPQQLRQALRRRGVRLAPPLIVARTGWTTDELADALDESEISGCFDLVSLSIGVNNQYRGRSVDEYAQQFSQLLQRAVALAGDRPQRVLVLSIPDWSASPFAKKLGRDRAVTARELARFNQQMREHCEQAGTFFVDITPTTVSDQPQDYAADGLHPSASVYALWVDLMAKPLATMLSPPCPH